MLDGRDDLRRDDLRQARDRHAPAERAGRHHQHEHEATGFHRLDEDAGQGLPFQRAVDHEAEKQCVQAGDRGRLGRREQPAEHAAEQDHRREQRPDAVAKGFDQSGEPDKGLPRKAFALGDDRHHHHQR